MEAMEALAFMQGGFPEEGAAAAAAKGPAEPPAAAAEAADITAAAAPSDAAEDRDAAEKGRGSEAPGSEAGTTPTGAGAAAAPHGRTTRRSTKSARRSDVEAEAPANNTRFREGRAPNLEHRACEQCKGAHHDDKLLTCEK